MRQVAAPLGMGALAEPVTRLHHKGQVIVALVSWFLPSRRGPSVGKSRELNRGHDRGTHEQDSDGEYGQRTEKSEEDRG